MSDVGPLRRLLEETAAEHGLPLKDLTVLTNDPFRIDTPVNHRLGRWLATTTQTLELDGRKIHNRGLHYRFLGQPKPDGTVYVSDDQSWALLEDASKAARWLGYIPFDQVVDQRNAPPVVRLWTPPQSEPYLNVGIDVEIPAAEDIEPTLGIDDFIGTQPYKIVMVGEKSSLDPVLGPIAERYQADLFLPTGDISDTQVYQIAQIGAADGRPTVVLYFADADPSGWNMGIVIARKLQAFKILHFPDLDFQVHRVALIPDQVRRFGLPSTPMKPTEKRANAWFAAFGVEQTEIDALATLRPTSFRRIARDAIAPFFDADLDRRVAEARAAWLDAAQAALAEQLDQTELDRIRAEADEKLSEMQQQIDEINNALRIDLEDLDLPEIEIPEPDLNGAVASVPLLDSGNDFMEGTLGLLASKAYRGNGAGS
jgi:hypothetical protein